MSVEHNNPQRSLHGTEVIERLFEGFCSREIAEWMIDNGYWPPMKPSSAAARVRACCDPDKDEFWKFSELVAWAAYTGRRVLADYVCDRTGLARPAATPQVSAELQRRLDELDVAERNRDAAIRKVRECAQAEGLEGRFEGEALGTPASVRAVRFSRKGAGDDG